MSFFNRLQILQFCVIYFRHLWTIILICELFMRAIQRLIITVIKQILLNCLNGDLKVVKKPYCFGYLTYLSL
jgi:hypothetical protein